MEPVEHISGMPEGPSIVILKEQVTPFLGKRIERVSGNTTQRSHILKKDLERVVVDARFAGLKLEDLTAVLAYHWDRLSESA